MPPASLSPNIYAGELIFVDRDDFSRFADAGRAPYSWRAVPYVSIHRRQKVERARRALNHANPPSQRLGRAAGPITGAPPRSATFPYPPAATTA